MLKLQIVENGRILLELPLSVRNWDQGELSQEIDDFENDLERVSSLFNVFSNSSRLRMMHTFFHKTGQSAGFTELMNELRMNPKIIWDSTKKLRQNGLIEKMENGRYRVTKVGEAQFLMTSIVLRKMLKILEEL